jgi:hypothetical protein
MKNKPNVDECVKNGADYMLALKIKSDASLWFMPKEGKKENDNSTESSDSDHDTKR